MERKNNTQENKNGRQPLPDVTYKGGYRDATRPFIVSVDSQALGEALSDFGLTNEQIEKLNIEITPETATIKRTVKENGKIHDFLQIQNGSLTKKDRKGKRTMRLYMGHHYVSHLATKTAALEYAYLSRIKNPQPEISFILTKTLTEFSPEIANVEKFGQYLKSIPLERVPDFIEEMNKRKIKQTLTRATIHYAQHLKDDDLHSENLLFSIKSVAGWTTLLSAGFNLSETIQHGITSSASDIPSFVTVAAGATWVVLRRKEIKSQRIQEINAKEAELPIPPKFKEAFNVSVNPDFSINALTNPKPQNDTPVS